jgi:3-hydroxyisobutyrate dehydrogenase-like beta-hydroxyacid dehydrogenase
MSTGWEAGVSELVIGLLHPGEMGAAVGAQLTGSGHPVCWASQGRGADTAARARVAGLSDVGSVAEVARRCGVVVSVCPPHAAAPTAHAIAAAGFRGLFVDANAISPASSRALGEVMTAAGADYVDGGIIGLAPTAERVSRLYLSGPRAAEVAALFAGTQLEAKVVDGRPGAASAVKMAYAAWTKGTAALLLAARALASAEGVQDALLAEWAFSQPALAERTRSAARSAAVKGWRWVAEMEEIGQSMDAAGLPAGFGEAAAEVYRRQPRAGSADSPTPAEVVAALLRARP